MWPFRKKKQKQEANEPPACNHKFQDFPWIMRFGYDYIQGTYHVEITEPYVCIYCKERVDKRLINDYYRQLNNKQIDSLIDEYKEKYKDHIKPKAVVEDMINDFQLVDREWLEIAKKLKEGRI